jgi:metal-responsive CopG/Arc/MetJ family transcriptional regulator
MKRTKPITISLPDKVVDRLNELCNKAAMTKSELIKILIVSQAPELEKALKLGGEGEVSNSR